MMMMTQNLNAPCQPQARNDDDDGLRNLFNNSL
jgi:hypothetical protein